MVLFINEDNQLWWKMVDNGGVSIPTATVTATILDSQKQDLGLPVINMAWDAANIEYNGILDKTNAQFTENQKLFVAYTGTDGGRDGYRLVPATARYHEVFDQ